MDEIVSVFKDAKSVKKLFLTVIICFLISLFYNEIVRFFNVSNDLGSINPFAPVIGLYLGPLGVVGISLATLVFNLLFYNLNFASMFFKVLAIFMYSYIPYKMWYTMGKSKQCKIPNLDDAGSIIKFIYTMFLNSICVVLLLYSASIFDNDNFDLLQIIFLIFNSFNFPLLFGIPAMIIFSVSKVKRYIPKVKNCNISTNKYVYIIVLAIVMGGLNLYYGENYSGGNLSFASGILSALMYFLLLIYINMPITKEIDTNINSNNITKVTLKGKVTIGFLAFGYLLISFDVVLFDFILKFVSNDEVLNIRIIYIVIGVCTYYVFAITLLVLLYVEKKITIPLDNLSNAVTTYSKMKDYNDKSNNKKIKDICNSVRSKNEIQEISDEFSKMIDRIEGYCENLESITEEREREKAEMNLASKIQESILPRVFPAFPERQDFDIYASMMTAKELGGDFYDFFMVAENKLCFLVADVSGKGAPAALVMMSAKTTIKDYLSMNLDIETVIEKVNKQLCKDNEVFMFITSFIAVVDLETGIMDYVSAGHNPPLIRKQNSEFEYMDVNSNCILAVDYYATFKKQTIKFDYGDVLFIYTDGITEALNSNGKFFGMDRLRKTLNDKYYEDIYQMIPYVKGRIDQFQDGFPQSDDITMLIFKYK